jgi:hypothetical protein
MANVIVGTLVFGLIAAALWKTIKNHRAGGCGCGCGECGAPCAPSQKEGMDSGIYYGKTR